MTEAKADLSKSDLENMPRCPICSAVYDKGYTIMIVGRAMFMLECRCGLYSRAFNTREDLLFWWRTRGGRKPERTIVKVKNGKMAADSVPTLQEALSELSTPDPF